MFCGLPNRRGPGKVPAEKRFHLGGRTGADCHTSRSTCSDSSKDCIDRQAWSQSAAVLVELRSLHVISSTNFPRGKTATAHGCTVLIMQFTSFLPKDKQLSGIFYPNIPNPCPTIGFQVGEHPKTIGARGVFVAKRRPIFMPLWRQTSSSGARALESCSEVNVLRVGELAEVSRYGNVWGAIRTYPHLRGKKP